MIDIKFLRENKELVKENIRKKFQDTKLPLVDEVVELDLKNREYKQTGDELRKERNEISGQIGALMRDKRIDEANEMKAKVVEINNKLVEIEKEEAEISLRIKEIMRNKIYETARPRFLITLPKELTHEQKLILLNILRENDCSKCSFGRYSDYEPYDIEYTDVVDALITKQK